MRTRDELLNDQFKKYAELAEKRHAELIAALQQLIKAVKAYAEARTK